MYTHNRAHEAWGLSNPPDFVTFSKKFLAGGIFHMKEAIPQEVSIMKRIKWMISACGMHAAVCMRCSGFMHF